MPPLPRIWLIGFLSVVGVNLIWEVLHTAPPPWDMASHQLTGLQISHAWESSGLSSAMEFLSAYYPPLYHLLEALIFRVWPNVPVIAALANLPGLFLLSYFTFRVSEPILGHREAQWAGILTLLFPMVAWTSRETLLDVSGAGLVTLSLYALIRSDGFTTQKETVLFAVCCAAGLLTRLSFIMFIPGPALLAFWHSSSPKRSLRNLLPAALFCLFLASLWYLPAYPTIRGHYDQAISNALVEGDPPITSALGLIYYPRALSSYYLQLPLTILFLCGVVGTWKKLRRAGPFDLRLVIWWLVSGVLILSFLGAKDPRYALPVAPALAILLLYYFKGKPRLISAVMGLAVFNFAAVSFEIPYLPRKVAFFETGKDYRSLSQEWVLFQTRYFGIGGPPLQEDWKHHEILETIPVGARVGFVPEHERFHSFALALAAEHQHRSLPVYRVGHDEESLRIIPQLDVLVGKTGNQGLSFGTEWSQAAYEGARQLGWTTLSDIGLPDGSQALVLLNPISAER